MENNIPWEIIGKNIRNESTPHEQELLREWLTGNEGNQKILSGIRDVYKISGSVPSFFQPDRKKAWAAIEKRIFGENTVSHSFIRKFRYVAAAMLIVLIGISSFWLYRQQTRQLLNQYTEIMAPMGHKTRVVLPDSSFVWLNAGSTLRYQGFFNRKKREVILEGEAFFDVKKDKNKIFTVKSGVLNVNVYGTAFNIKNYGNDNLLEITVAEGRVGIADFTKEIRQLTKGEQAILNKETNKISFSNSDPDMVAAWKNDELIFDNTPMEEMVKYLERWYGVDIGIEDSMVGQHNYTFRIKTESFTEMLEKMKLITPITYEINGKRVKIRYTD